MGEPPLYLSRFPGYDVMARAEHWDRGTRAVVEARIRDVPPRRFFTQAEADALQSLADTVVPQEDRPESLQIPLVEPLDARLHAGEGAGYHYEQLSPDREFWRAVASAWDDEARLAHARRAADLSPDERAALFARVHDHRPDSTLWASLGLDLRFAVPQILEEFGRHYYGHPYAWNEIGFPGPVFPEIYARTLRDDPREALEVERDRP